jgi:uncharacterized membrane protein
VTPSVIGTIIVILNAALFYAVPVLSRRDIFFSVTVPAGFREQPIARRALLRYRTAVLASSTIALAAASAMVRLSPRLVPLVVIVQPAVATLAWMLAHRAIRPYAATSTAPRVASLTPRDVSYPGGIPAIVGPYIMLGAAALLLYLNWDAIPGRFPTHWNGSGVPDRWTTKSIRSVFGFLPFGIALVAAMQIQAWLVLRRTRQIAATGAMGDAEWRVKRRTAQYSVLSSFLAALLLGYFATRSLAADVSLGWGIWIILGVIVVASIAFTAWYVYVGQGGQRQIPAAALSQGRGDASPDAAWKGGILYFNPDDPAIFVENRMGVGWTMNFGNKWAWAFVIAAIGAPLFIVMLLTR